MEAPGPTGLAAVDTSGVDGVVVAGATVAGAADGTPDDDVDTALGGVVDGPFEPQAAMATASPAASARRCARRGSVGMTTTSMICCRGIIVTPTATPQRASGVHSRSASATPFRGRASGGGSSVARNTVVLGFFQSEAEADDAA